MPLNQTPVGGSLRGTGKTHHPPPPSHVLSSIFRAGLFLVVLFSPPPPWQVLELGVCPDIHSFWIQQVFIESPLCARYLAIGAYILVGGKDKEADRQIST